MVAAIQPASLTLLQINLCELKTIENRIQEKHKDDRIDIMNYCTYTLILHDGDTVFTCPV